jgi:hypothetical protein
MLRGPPGINLVVDDWHHDALQSDWQKMLPEVPPGKDR